MTSKKIKLKTINNQQLVGTGNITIESGSNIDIITSTNGWESTLSDSKVPSEKLVKNNLDIKEDTSNKVTSWSNTLSDSHYPSEKLVKDTIDANGLCIADFYYDDETNDIVINTCNGRDLQGINTKEDLSNKVTALSSSSTNSQYPSAKCLYDILNSTYIYELSSTKYSMNVGEQVTVTCTVKDLMGNPIENEPINAKWIYGSTTGTIQTKYTNSNGVATLMNNSQLSSTYEGLNTFVVANQNIQIMVNNDTGWKDVTFESNYGNYDTNNKVQYRRVGKIVTIKGIAKNTNTVTLSDTSASSQIATISDTTCRPSSPYRAIEQGSGLNRWLLTVGTDGALTLARYGTTGITNVAAGSWLNIYCTFMVG